LQEYVVAPAQTDPAITTALDDHYAYVNTTVTAKNLLVVFFPGTGADPRDYRTFVQEAANLGYHAIGLMYPNSVTVNSLCITTNDTTCHSNVRREIIDGTDRSAAVDVDTTNCIIHRLVKLLQYLQTVQPSEHWDQYLSGGAPNWPKIIVSGHSQGGGMAGIMSKYYPVHRAIIFSDMDFLSSGRIPDWVDNPAHADILYTLVHPKDELIPYAVAVNGWQYLGIGALGAITNVDSAAYPYGQSHTLITRLTPAIHSIIQYHNCTAADGYVPTDANGNYVLDTAWKYLLGD
jgi:hypothetical protein